MSSASKTEEQVETVYIVKREFYPKVEPEKYAEQVPIRSVKIGTEDFEKAAALYFEGSKIKDEVVESMMIVQRDGHSRPLNRFERAELKRYNPEEK